MLKKIKKIKNEIGVISHFIMSFGYLRWLPLYIKFKFKAFQKFQPPGIQHPFILRKDSTDRAIFYELFVDRNMGYLKDIGQPKYIIDGGANIGLSAIIYKNLFPDSTIICVEPDSINIETLKKNIAPYNNMYIEQAGIWNTDARLRIYDKYGFGQSGLVVEEDENNGTIQGTTISSIIKKYNLPTVDLLKLDIETSEKYLFEKNYQDWLPQVKSILIELHDRFLPGCGRAFFHAIDSTYPQYHFDQFDYYTLIVNLNATPKP